MPFAKDQHPRLYFSKEDLPTIRRRARSGMRAHATAFITGWADRLLDPADPDFFDYQDMRRDLWRQRDSIMTWRSALNFLTWAYVLTGEKRYGQAACDALMITIHRKLADIPYPAEGADHDGWRRSRMHQHDKGNYAATICLVYDCCHDLLTDEQRRTFIDHALESHAIFMDPKVLDRDRPYINNNRGARSFTGCAGYYRLTLEGDVENIPEPFIHAAEQYLFMAFDSDGYPLEGHSYGGVLAEMYLFLTAVARSGRDDLRRLPVFEQCLQAAIYETLPWGETCNNLNDAERITGGAMPFIGVMSRPEGAAVSWLLRKIDLHPRREALHRENLIQAYYCAPWFAVALFWEEGIPLRTPQELGYPLAHCFPEAGVAALRTGWEDDDLLLVHRAGPCVPLLHSQSDQNHLALYALGERFLVDEGYGERMNTWPADVPPPEPGRFCAHTQAHNTVLIDGQSQNGTIAHPGRARGKFRHWHHTDAFTTTLGDARAAYSSNRVIEQAMRRVVLVRDVPRPFVVVIDTAAVDQTDTPHVFEVRWRTDDANRIEAAGGDFVIAGQHHDCHGRVLWSSAPFTSEVASFAMAPQLRVRVEAPRLEMVTVHCPVPRGQAVPQFTCQRDASGDFVVTMRDGRHQCVVTAGTRVIGPMKQAVEPVVQTSMLQPEAHAAVERSLV